MGRREREMPLVMMAVGRSVGGPIDQLRNLASQKRRKREEEEEERKPKPAPQRKILGTEERGERSFVSGRLITAAAEEIMRPSSVESVEHARQSGFVGLGTYRPGRQPFSPFLNEYWWQRNLQQRESVFLLAPVINT